MSKHSLVSPEEVMRDVDHVGIFVTVGGSELYNWLRHHGHNWDSSDIPLMTEEQREWIVEQLTERAREYIRKCI